MRIYTCNCGSINSHYDGKEGLYGATICDNCGYKSFRPLPPIGSQESQEDYLKKCNETSNKKHIIYTNDIGIRELDI